MLPTQMDFINEIKERKELSGFSNKMIASELKSYLNKNQISLENLKGKDRKLVVKEIRGTLRKYVGRFYVSRKRKLVFLNKNEISELLKTHSSTKERLPFYDNLIKIINNLSPKSILDLGCGLNPIAIANSGTKYFACDINKEDLEIVKAYFKKNNISGKVFYHDLRNLNENIPDADLCLLLKIFDVIETKNHKMAEEIIKKLNCKNILISFSTKTLSGKPMNHPQRVWIERLLSRLGYEYQLIKEKNEIFYLVKKIKI